MRFVRGATVVTLGALLVAGPILAGCGKRGGATAPGDESGKTSKVMETQKSLMQGKGAGGAAGPKAGGR